MKRLVLALVIGVALLTAACGGGGGPMITPPPPTGKYSLASLSGTYAFITSGEVCAGCSTATPMMRVGSFVADGKGGITGGIEDVNSDGTPNAAQTITGGSYSVSADGRGGLTLNFANGNSINFGIVLTSTSDGLLIDETSNTSQASTGSGNFILQQSTPFALTELTGNYVFDFSGLDGVLPPNGPNPESFIGQLTLDGATGTASGVFDDNDGGTLTSNATMLPGTIAQDPSQLAAFTSFGRGIATIAGQNFVFYIVDANRVRFISITNGMLSGDAVAQSNIPANLNAFNGGFAFIVAGSDSVGNGLIRVGRFTLTNGTVSNIMMDVNQGGSFPQFNTLSMPAIAYDPTTGRGEVSFQASTLNVFDFVFYLSSSSGGVIQEVSPNDTTPASAVADGSLLAQSGGPFSGSNVTGTYGLNWSGVVTAQGSGFTDEEDLVGQVNITNLALSGTCDIFQFTSNTLQPVFDDPIGAQSQITFNGGNGTGDDGKRVFMNVQLSGQAPVDMVVYIVSPQLAFFANRTSSSGRIVAGILKAQQ